MAEVRIRRATREDAVAIAAVANAETQALYGEPDADAATVGGWFELPELGMFVAEVDGRVAGYADVRRDEDGARFPLDVRVHPELGGRGVVEALVDALEQWASARAQPNALLRAFVAERDRTYRQEIERRGYELVRHSFTMEIDLPEAVDAPEWPAGLTVRTYDPDHDEVPVYEAVQESFADHWDFHPIPLETWRSFRDADPRFEPALWWVVEDDGEVAAVCLNGWSYTGDPTLGWIETLGVRRPWRRRGVALALLRHSFRDFAARGATRVGLGVDAENTTGAVRLYERAGMRPVRRQDQYSRTL